MPTFSFLHPFPYLLCPRISEATSSLPCPVNEGWVRTQWLCLPKAGHLGGRGLPGTQGVVCEVGLHPSSTRVSLGAQSLAVFYPLVVLLYAELQGTPWGGSQRSSGEERVIKHLGAKTPVATCPRRVPSAWIPATK